MDLANPGSSARQVLWCRAKKGGRVRGCSACCSMCSSTCCSMRCSMCCSAVALQHVLQHMLQHALQHMLQRRHAAACAAAYAAACAGAHAAAPCAAACAAEHTKIKGEEEKYQKYQIPLVSFFFLLSAVWILGRNPGTPPADASLAYVPDSCPQSNVWRLEAANSSLVPGIMRVGICVFIFIQL